MVTAATPAKSGEGAVDQITALTVLALSYEQKRGRAASFLTPWFFDERKLTVCAADSMEVFCCRQ